MSKPIQVFPRVAVCALIAICFPACPGEVTHDKWVEITGVVQSQTSDEPISSASVVLSDTLTGPRDVTDSAGEFLLLTLPIQEESLIVRAVGYEKFDTTLTDVEDDIELLIELNRSP